MPDHASAQPLPEWVTWDCCNQVYDAGTPCTGAAQADYGRCLAYLDDTQLVSVMTRRPDEAPPDLDARGVRLGPGDLKRVLAAAARVGALARFGRVSLERAMVEGNVSLDKATVEGGVSLARATVKGGVSLSGATVNGHVVLDGAAVDGDVSLHGTTVKGDVSVDRADVAGNVFLEDVTVRRNILTLSGERLDLSGVRLIGGFTARVSRTEVVMERVEVQGSASLTRASTGLAVPASPARLLQIAGTDVALLTLKGVDLSACRFSGAINLDKLHIDGSPRLAVFQGWRAHRKVIAEERVWRCVYGSAQRGDVWYPPECRPRSSDEAQQILDAEASVGRPRERAHEIAAVYRALRKGREGGKDEPGAADFYYGEMEMRHKAAGGSIEGVPLTGVTGNPRGGRRGSRPLVW